MDSLKATDRLSLLLKAMDKFLLSLLPSTTSLLPNPLLRDISHNRLLNKLLSLTRKMRAVRE